MDRSITTAQTRSLGVLCVCLLAIILVAGLWPFHAPLNRVEWLSGTHGLRFGRFGSAVSVSGFRGEAGADAETESLEVCLEPAQLRVNRTILAFDGSQHPGSPFTLRQIKDALRVQRYNVDGQGTARTAWFDVKGVFHEDTPVVVSVILGKNQTAVYVNGILAENSALSGVSNNNLTGRLVLANSPATSDNWPGKIFGLALYREVLTPAQVVRHYEHWTKDHQLSPSQDEAAIALYRFDEGTGAVARNTLDASTDLKIPSHYFVLHPSFLSSPRRDYHPTWNYAEDVLVNVSGFIPFGFCLAVYLSAAHRRRHAGAIAVGLGFLTSLTIEVLQAFLPTRGSGTTDLITNTVGTALGVALCRWSAAEPLLARVGVRLEHEAGSREDAHSVQTVA